MNKDKKQELADIWAGLHRVKPATSRADELIACLEGEVKSRDARIAELESKRHDDMKKVIDCADQRDQLRAELAQVAQADANYQSEALRLASELADTRDKMRAVVAERCEAQDELAAIKAQEPVAWMLKNEKGRIEEILPYMPCASDMQLYWPEPTPLYAAPVAKQVVMPDLPEFAKKVIRKLQRVESCFSDGQATDVGRHWLDLLTQLGLLIRQQRSPALWEISQQGEDLLTSLNAADHAGGGV